MPWRFRRRFSLGPFHFNVNRRGLGGSIGFRGFRIGITNRGNLYISVGAPGSGLSFYREFGKTNRSGKSER